MTQYIVRPVFASVLLVASAHFCFGEWVKTIHCPPGRVYRDLRKYAGREEFCELRLPGSLVVKDGPYRSWFSEGHLEAEGIYELGREVGQWNECDPYANGEYTFDFASCRSTWITQTSHPDPINLNIIGTSPYRCEIAYTPQSILENGVRAIISAESRL